MKETLAPSGLTYRHEEDFSETVTVELPVSPDGHWDGDGDCAMVSDPYAQRFTQRRVVKVEIPFKDLKHMVLQQLRREAIIKLEQSDDATLEKFFGWSAEEEM